MHCYVLIGRHLGFVDLFLGKADNLRCKAAEIFPSWMSRLHSVERLRLPVVCRLLIYQTVQRIAAASVVDLVEKEDLLCTDLRYYKGP